MFGPRLDPEYSSSFSKKKEKISDCRLNRNSLDYISKIHECYPGIDCLSLDYNQGLSHSIHVTEQFFKIVSTKIF